MSHPSLMRRLAPIAERAGITPETLQALVEQAHTGDSYYTVPASVLDDAKVFSSEARHRILLLCRLALLVLCAVPPALVALAVARYEGQGLVRIAAYVGAILLTVPAIIYVSGFLNMTGRRKLKSRLLAKLACQGVDLSDYRPAFVGFSPDDTATLYEGFTNSDIGFFFTRGNRLCFFGDSIRFSLPRQNVVAAELGRVTPGWYRRQPVVIEWRNNEGGAGRFCVSSYEVCHTGSVTAANKRIIKWIKTWQNGRPDAGVIPEEFEPLGLPGDVTVNGAPFRVGWRLVFRTSLPPVFLAFLLCLAFGLVRLGEDAGPALYAMAAAMLVHVLYHLPYTKRSTERTT
ncbi:MAG: hypothetical protein NTZ09_09225 [Candidatus Hydrogenedentes bacterium]|nr:hypothetical protein [Candidatus Hydrogenedentota bacterium]